ncbi:MAG: tetratricopeptide repeat protein [Sandaracinaceae bacterium]
MAVSWRLAIASLALIVASLSASSRVEAQSRIACSRDPASETEARALFRAGVAATNQERWADAISSLRRAYELSCHAPALFNLGYSLRALGRHREARDVLTQLLSDHSDVPENIRQNAEQFLEQERGRVAVLELLEVGQGIRPEIVLDGRSITDDGGRPVRLETDAGTHALVLRLDDHQPFLWNGELADGQVEQVVVRFTPIPTGGGDSFEWGWVVFGVVAAAVVAGGIVAGVLLQDEAQLRPLSSRMVTIGGS